MAQKSNLGVPLAQNLVISGIGQADDTVLLSNDLHKLFCLLVLTLEFCSKYNVELCAEKTRLQMFPSISNPSPDTRSFLNPIKINDTTIRADHFYCRLPSKSTFNVDILKLFSMSDHKSQVDFKQKQKTNKIKGSYN